MRPGSSPTISQVRKANNMTNPDPTENSPAKVLQRMRRTVPVTPIDILSDTLMDGLAMAMLPLSVDWPENGSDDPVLHTVNMGSNPVTGRVSFGSLRVPLDRVIGVEFVTVNVKAFGMDTPAAHAQLRFLFEKGEGPAMVDAEGRVSEPTMRIPDLIVSWEAWRAPGKGFNFFEGLDAGMYSLSPRAYEGAQRFLEDGLKDCSWNCRPIDLPGGREAYRELLRTALLAGDGLTRSQVAARLKRDDAGILDDDTRVRLEDWSQSSPESMAAVDGLLGGDLTYQLLERSCITMALYTVDLCLGRLFESGKIHERPVLNIVPDSVPEWIGGLAHANARAVGASLGKIIGWVHKHSTVIPGSSYRILEDAGLLRQEHGKTVVHHYDLRAGKSPYGNLKDYLIG